MTIDAGWDEEDDVSESSQATTFSLDCKNIDGQGYVKLPKTGTEMKGPNKSGFAPIWGFEMVPTSSKFILNTSHDLSGCLLMLLNKMRAHM